MGKASRWFRSLLGLKKPDPTTPSPNKRRWPFVKSSKPSLSVTSDNNDTHADPYKHAIAVAAATAAVAEAAVAAAHTAAEVVRLTSSGRCGNNMPAYFSGRGVGYDEHFAAVRIQAAFRGYLARKALRALKSVVSLQALVRGHLQRKRTAAWLSRMQYSVLQAKAHAHGGRVPITESSHSSGKSSHFQHPCPPTPEKFEHYIQAKSGKYEPSSILKRTGSKSNDRPICDQDAAHLSFNWSEFQLDVTTCDGNVPMEKASSMDDENKIPEVDAGKPHKTPKRRNLFHSHHNSSDLYCQSFTASKDSATHQTVPSPSTGEVQSRSPLKFSFEEEEAFCTADNSPHFCSVSSQGGSCKRNPFTPTKSDGSRSFLSSFSDYPNYMSYTESSKAKVRSLSAPKQRPQYERSTSTKRYSIHGYGGEARSSSAQRASALRANFTSKAYPGSGRLDRLGMPIGQRF